MSKKVFEKIFFIGFFAVVILYFWNDVSFQFERVSELRISVNPLPLALSFIVGWGIVIYWWYLWKKLLGISTISNTELFYIHSISWLGKYFPWKAWIVLAKVYLLSKHGISKKRSVMASLYENIFQILSSFVVALPILSWYFLSSVSSYHWLISIVIILGFSIIIHPTVFYWTTSIGLKFFKKDPLDPSLFLSPFEILEYVFLYSIGIIWNGVALFLMISWITAVDWIMLMPTIGIWSFSGVLWLLAIFAPAGLWVREWIMILLFQFYLPTDMAILIGIISRAWTTAIDGLIAIYAAGFKASQK
jgi:hypothetical protein